MQLKTIGDVLRASAARLPDKPAIITERRRLSYRELDAAADRFANALIGHGLGAGRTVAILSPNRAEYPVFFFGAARAGGLQAHLSVRYTAQDLGHLIAHTGIDAVFVDQDLLPVLLEAWHDLPDLKTVVCFDGAAGEDVVAFDEFVKDADETPPTVSIDPAQPACLTYTGGTTGFPKGVLATHAARVLSTEIAWVPFAMREDDIVFLASPMFHVAGLFSWFTTAVYGGCTTVFMSGWDPARFIEVAERENVTATCMVPTQINAVISHPSLDPDKLPRLRYFNYGGSPMPEALLRRAFEMFPDLVMLEHYGQSEVGPACYRPAEMALKKPASVGRPLDELRLEIRDRDNRALPRGQIGEITVKGDYLFAEYYRDPEQTAAAHTPDGWCKTGDLGFVDEDGYVFLVDRSKDMIIAGGENVYPAEIENALYDHEAVAEAAVFGIPDDEWGELPAAHVVLKDGTKVSEDALIDFVAGKIARHKRPRLVKFVDALPKTAVGKVRKNLLRAPYWKGRERAI